MKAVLFVCAILFSALGLAGQTNAPAAANTTAVLDFTAENLSGEGGDWTVGLADYVELALQQEGVPTLEQVAKRLATSERTLRRRLEEGGTSFRNLLDETRAELARSYVRDRRLPLTEVAFLLGFSEPSAFHRAFKRWTDTTPSAWRQRAEG